MKPAEGAAQQKLKSSVFSEINDRKRRRHNVVIHGLAEAPADVIGKDRATHDLARLQELLQQIEVQMEANDLIKFSKRLGSFQGRRNPDKPRPLLIGVSSDEIVETLTEASQALKVKPAPWKDVRIVRDLTAQHREEERSMFAEVEELVKALSEEDAKKFTYKVVGPRGSRQIRKLPKRPDAQAVEDEVQGVAAAVAEARPPTPLATVRGPVVPLAADARPKQ